MLERYPRHEKLALLAPSNQHSDEWVKLTYMDERTGKTYRLYDRSKEKRVNGIVQDDSKFPMPQLWGHVLLHLQNHPEAKCAGGDGIGLLGHWQINVTGLWIIGKEIQRELVAGESFSEIEPAEPLVYGCVKQNSARTKRTLSPMVIDRLRSEYSIKKLVKKTKLNRSVVRRAVRGESIHQRSWELLMKEYESSI